jgi:accessory gene regulator protein AgrB
MALGANFGVMTMPDDTKVFIRTLCTISATMASISFIGVSIIITKFYPTTNTVWRLLGIYGAISVVMFAAASFFALMSLALKSKDKERRLLYASVTFGFGWAFFLILTLSLVAAFLV